MDTKALAKSKRAHSLHHSKKHQPHQAPKAASTGSGTKKPTANQYREKAPQFEHSRLPSNWERYDEDLNLDSEEAQSSSSQQTEFVVPRSKGADYAQLISDAKAHSSANYSSEVCPLFHDAMYGFTQDFGPMLAAKGQSILSWIADDNFEFEGKESIIPEAPFLSLDLNALAAQLAKAKLSERIFIEPDLLPRELLDDDLQACSEDKHDPQTRTSSAETDFRTSSIAYNQEVAENVRQCHKPEERLKPMKQTKYEISHSQETTNISEQIVDSTTEKPPIFEAANAELELDMLLESLSESSIGISSSGESTKRGTHAVTDIVDDIDNLLEETSNLTGKNGTQLFHGVKALPDVSSKPTMDPTLNSKVVDDFASWLDTI